MNNTKLIQDYYAGVLSEIDVITFETRLSQDKAFAQEVNEYDELSKNIEEVVEPSFNEEGGEETISYAKRYKHIYIAAAVIIIAVLVSQYLEKKL